MNYWLGVIGAFIVMDCVASLWTYCGRDNETFWRNHALRIWRGVLGIILVIMGATN
mgnify:CR=1 FL=1